MDDGKPVQAPILDEEIDDAPVGKRGNGQVRDALQLGLVVERAGQDLARLGEESDVVLAADPVDEVLAGDLILRGAHRLLRSGRHLVTRTLSASAPLFPIASTGGRPWSRGAATVFHAG